MTEDQATSIITLFEQTNEYLVNIQSYLWCIFVFLICYIIFNVFWYLFKISIMDSI